MKGIRLLFRWLAVMMFLWLSVCFSRVWAQYNAEKIDGKVTFMIESKTLTADEARTAITAKTAIPLKVSLIFEGQWVNLFSSGDFEAYLNASALSFGIAQKSGTDEASAPLYRINPPAYIYSNPAMGCTADGTSLALPSTAGAYISRPTGERFACPEFAYGVEFNNGNAFTPYETTIDGKKCYVLDLFSLYFRLKEQKTVYVRGIDCNGASDGKPSTDDEGTLTAWTKGTTILNIINASTTNACYWPGAPNAQSADWTLAPDGYYGGVIPGGIFIEEAPVVVQFEPSLSRGKAQVYLGFSQ